MGTAVQKIADRFVDDRLQRQYDILIPTGGRGGEMFPLTAGMPKALLPVNSKPMLVNILERLDHSVFRRAMIMDDVWHSMVREYVEAFRKSGAFRMNVEYSTTQTEGPLTAKILDIYQNLSDPFLLHYCDIVITDDVRWPLVIDEYKSYFQDKDKGALLIVSSSFRYNIGWVEMDGANRVTKFEEKPKRILVGWANCGVALIGHDFVRRFFTKDRTDVFKHCVSQAANDDMVFGHSIADWDHLQTASDWFDIQKHFYPHMADRFG